MRTVQLRIKGKVQGVFYRATAKDVAEETGIKGWVKNTPEGDVEIVASGEDGQLEKFIAWCREGPPRARVTDVIVTEKDSIRFENFSIAG